MSAGDPSVLLSHHLKALKLPVFLREYPKAAARCAKENKDMARFLLELCEQELLEREQKSAQRRIVEAGFPVIKTLDSYDFLALPGLNKLLVTELSRGEYIGRRENVLAVGNSGTGKTHRKRWGTKGLMNQTPTGEIPPVGWVTSFPAKAGIHALGSRSGRE